MGSRLMLLPVLWLGLSLVIRLQPVCCVSPRGTTLSDTQREDIQTFIEDVMECYSIPGLTLAVVGADDDADNDRDWWTYTASFGKADMVQDIDVTNKTLFNIGSSTKAFTSALLAMLLEESDGKYTWDTPIKEILGDSFFLNDEYRTNKVTLIDLLSHRVGAARHDFLWILGFITDREELLKRIHLVEMVTEFRTTYLYNNLMYSLAGAVAEKIGGKSWEELIQEKIFDPLGMEDSTFLDKMGSDYVGLARVHYWVNNGSLEQADKMLYQYINPVSPAGSIVSNAEDMAKWLLFQLNGGKDKNGASLIAAQALYYPHKPQVAVPHPMSLAVQPQYPASEDYATYGMGWFRGDYRGDGGIRHGGSLLGYETLVTLQRVPRLAMYTSMNGPMTEICHTVLGLLHMYISDVIMQREQWLSGENACSYPQPWEPPPPGYSRYPGSALSIDKDIEPGRDLDDYVGTYANHLYGELRVWVNASEGRLEATTKSLTYHFAMYPKIQTNEFAAMSLGIAAFFDVSDVLADMPPAPRMVRFTTKGEKDEVHQLHWMGPELVVFERGLDISTIPKPDFLEKETCKDSGSMNAASVVCLLCGVIIHCIFTGRTSNL